MAAYIVMLKNFSGKKKVKAEIKAKNQKEAIELLLEPFLSGKDQTIFIKIKGAK